MDYQDPLREKVTHEDPVTHHDNIPIDPTAEVNSHKELGFGNTLTEHVRFILTDGSFNVKRRGIHWLKSWHGYQWLKTVSWQNFFLLLIGVFIIVNVFFASIYFFLGPKAINGIREGCPEWERFAESFFFSVQTFTTVGYGRLSPQTFGASMVAALESFIGLLGAALATGLLFARFSRPDVKILYSKNAIIAPHRDKRALQIKFVNARANTLVEAEVQISLAMLKQEENGIIKREFYTLPLEVYKINFFSLSWTVVHYIDESSPLQKIKSLDQLQKADAEIMLMFKAFDETFAQIVYSRHSYTAQEIIWGAKFKSIFHVEGEDLILEIDKLDDIEPAALPEEG